MIYQEHKEKSKIRNTFSITNKSKIVNQCSVFDIKKFNIEYRLTNDE